MSDEAGTPRSYAGPDGTASVQHGAGTPDALERLWAPYRMAYIVGENKPTGSGPDDGCPFCEIPEGSDEDGLVVARGREAYVLLNLYPYNTGHLMVCPYRHVADYTELDGNETVEVAELTRRAIRTLRAVSRPEGFNVGLNLGDAAGAGIAAHLHQHVVPRWVGDTNFMPVIGGAKSLPMLLRDTRALLAEAWPTA